MGINHSFRPYKITERFVRIMENVRKRFLLVFSIIYYTNRYIEKKNLPEYSERDFVEMGGLEPPSKQRTRELSTRLSVLWLSATGCRKAGYPKLSPCVLVRIQRHYPTRPV